MNILAKNWLMAKATLVFAVLLVLSLVSLLAPTREEEMNAATPESCLVIESYMLVNSSRLRVKVHDREYRIRVKSEAKDVVEECRVEVFRYRRIRAGDTLTLYRGDDGTLFDPLSNVIPSSRWRKNAILILFCAFAFCLNRYVHYRPLAARARRDRDRQIGASLVRDHSVASPS